jgi:anti-sigma regulatory factor (Ser/Thr protein kinase)
VPATPQNVAALRHAVTRLARMAGASDQAQGDVALAVGEACGNVVMHAYPPGETGPLIVEGRLTEDGDLEVIVSDLGRGVAPRPDSAGLGLGLPLMSTLTKALRITDGDDGIGTQVRMVFDLA